MENITKDQTSDESTSLDQEIKSVAKSIEMEDDNILTFPFLDLPAELQYEFLKDYLSEKETKIARLVCHDWNLTCSNKLKLNPPPGNDITFGMLQNTLFKFEDLTVTDLTDNSSVQHAEVGKFTNVIVLKFKNTHISVENLEWLLKECVNVEEIHIIQSDFFTRADNSHPCDQFMISKISRYIHLCQNLRKLKIYAWYDQRVCTEALVLDCEFFSGCKKLEQFSVYSLNPFILVNQTSLPQSIERLHVVLFSREPTQFEHFLSTSISPFWSHIPNLEHGRMDVDLADIEIPYYKENISRLFSYFPSAGYKSIHFGGRCIFKSNVENLVQTLPSVLSILGYTEVEPISAISSILMEFKDFEFPFVTKNSQ